MQRSATGSLAERQTALMPRGRDCAAPLRHRILAPVLATAAAPCSEPRKQGRTGCFCADPCRDAGADVDRVLTGIENGVLRPDHDAATPHLHAFSMPHFADRLDAMMAPVAAAAKRAFPA